MNRSPEQYFNEFNTGEKIREIREFKRNIVVHDDLLEYNQNQINPFLNRRRHKVLDA